MDTNRPYQFDEYKCFSVVGGPVDFAEYLNDFNNKGWTLVNGGMTNGEHGSNEWWAIMGKDNESE